MEGDASDSDEDGDDIDEDDDVIISIITSSALLYHHHYHQYHKFENALSLDIQFWPLSPIRKVVIIERIK